MEKIARDSSGPTKTVKLEEEEDNRYWTSTVFCIVNIFISIN